MGSARCDARTSCCTRVCSTQYGPSALRSIQPSQASLPRVEKQEPRALTRDQVRLILEATSSEADGALYALELATGLRKGELLGLHWAKNERAAGVDLTRAELRV